MNYSWIVNESKLPWLKLDLEFPYQAMYKEAKSLKDKSLYSWHLCRKY